MSEPSAPKKGYVYCITNPEMPTILKIGMAGDTPEKLGTRMKELYRHAGVPGLFELHCAVLVSNSKKLEKKLHELLGGPEGYSRVNPKREFFRVDTETAERLMKSVAEDLFPDEPIEYLGGNDFDPEGGPVDDILEEEYDATRNSRDLANKRSSHFRFDELGIPIGATLTFKEDSEITVKVIDEKRAIEFEGKETSLSAVARDLMKARPQGWKSDKIDGPSYFKYEDETINERRTRMEAEED